MPNIRSTALVFHGLRTWLVQAFFANFFRLLLVTISLSQWCVLWWVFPQMVAALPPAGRWLAPVLIYAINRWLVMRTRRRSVERAPATRMPRLYYACALTCLFCTLFLLLTGAVWITAKVFVEAIAVEAWTTHAGLAVDSTLDALFRYAADAGLIVIGLTFGYGYTIGQQRLRITQLALPLFGFPVALNGLRIVQISDIHVGQNLTLEQLAGFVARVNALAPDLICVTGDIIDGPSADVASFLPVLAELRAPHGVAVILGNHDHYAGADDVEAALRRLTPFTILRDQHMTITVRGHALHIIGLDDRGRDWARGVPRVPYLDAALETVPPGEPILLLCHRPDIFPQAAAAKVALTLSGHTHGGQLGVPWFNGRVRNLAEFITDFDRGLFEQDGSYLYVNCGLGVTGQRIRLSTPREIAVIEVRNPVAAPLAA